MYPRWMDVAQALLHLDPVSWKLAKPVFLVIIRNLRLLYTCIHQISMYKCLCRVIYSIFQ